MIKVAITGSIASGKSLVEKFLRQEGATTLDTDKVVHELLEKDKAIIKKVSELFKPIGVDVRNNSGSIDRKKIGQVVFSDKQKLKELEKILHPEVKKITEAFFENNKDKKLIVVCAPLLYEANMENMFNFVITVTACQDIRLERLIKTRNLNREQALNRIGSLDFGKEKLEKADFVIENNGSIEDLQLKTKEVLDKILCHKLPE